MSSLTFTENLRAGSEEVGRQEKTGKKKSMPKDVENIFCDCFFAGGRSLKFRVLPDNSLYITYLPYILIFLCLLLIFK